MVYKKSCGNIIKFVSQNIPHALIQVTSHFIAKCISSFKLVPIPPQAVIIAVYCFGMITLMARNFSNPQNSSHVVSGYLPLMPGMQVST